MFELSATSARTGVVSSNFFINPDRLRTLLLGLLWLIWIGRLCHFWTLGSNLAVIRPSGSFYLASSRLRTPFRYGDISFKKKRGYIVVELLDHLLEKLKRFKLVNKKGVFLFVSCLLNRLPQVVHFAQMFFPRIVNDGKGGIAQAESTNNFGISNNSITYGLHIKRTVINNCISCHRHTGKWGTYTEVSTDSETILNKIKINMPQDWSAESRMPLAIKMQLWIWGGKQN